MRGTLICKDRKMMPVVSSVDWDSAGELREEKVGMSGDKSDGASPPSREYGLLETRTEFTERVTTAKGVFAVVEQRFLFS